MWWIGILSFFIAVHAATNAYSQEKDIIYGEDVSTIQGLSPRVDAGTTTHLPGKLRNYLYLRSPTEDETILAWTIRGSIWVSHDQGGQWEQVLPDEDAVLVETSFYHPDMVWVATESGKLFVSEDRAHHFYDSNAPPPNMLMPTALSIDRSNAKRVLLHAQDNCDDVFGDCRTDLWYTEDLRQWRLIKRDVTKCMWAGLETAPESLIYCQIPAGDGNHALVASEDFFRSKEVELMPKLYAVALEDPFLVAAVPGSHGTVMLQVSQDGYNFFPAVYPDGLGINERVGYTVLNSETRSLLLFATVSSHAGQEFGPILKSNSNGTHLSLSLENVNRDNFGFVDFERIKSTEGAALANVIANADDAKRGARKRIQTRITHSDGAFWDPLPSPDDGGEPLQLHGYTERKDFRDESSSESAVALIIGLGNTGEELGEIRNASTYLSSDAGITWQEVAPFPAQWEIGDSGALLVLVDTSQPTKELRYSSDFGKTWDTMEFSDEFVEVIDISSIPSDESRKFVIWAIPPPVRGDQTAVIQVDLSSLAPKKCKDSDFYLWTPEHPRKNSKCLFGHEANYRRRKPEAKCYIGKHPPESFKTLRDCKCTREDFECDIGYALGSDGACVLQGEVPTKEIQCDLPGAIAWHEVTGYRKVPISTCEGGEQLDKPMIFPCPGREEEFEKLFGRPPIGRGFGSFLSILLFLLILGAVGVWIIIVFLRKAPGGIVLGGGEEPDLPPWLDRIASFGANAWSSISSLLPGRQSHHLYERLDDEERYRILEEEYTEDPDLEPELEDAEELDVN